MKFNHIYIILLLIGTTCSIQCQKKSIKDTIPLDSSIRYGKLPNGFTYYIKPVNSHLSKIDMRLIVKGGSNLHDSDQIDMSHFLEHMAFKSSKHFPMGIKNNKQLDSFEVRPWDITAFSAINRTSYYFNIPERNAYALEKGLLWFKDIVGGGLNLTTDEINAERGVLRQESIARNTGGNDLNRLSKGKKLAAKIDPGLKTWTHDDNYRLENYRTFKPDILRRYYNDWYRPDLSALMIVGNIKNVDSLEALVNKIFSEIPKLQNLRKWKNTDSIYFNQVPQFAKITWPLVNRDSTDKDETVIHLGFRDPITRSKLHTEEGLRRELLWNLLSQVFFNRSQHLEERYNTKINTFNKYLTYDSNISIFYVRNVFGIKIFSEGHSEKEAVDTTINLLHQLYQFGLLEEEWDSLKKEQIHKMDRGVDDKTSFWLEEMNKHFLYAEALPERKNTYLKNWFQGLSLKQVNKKIKNLISEMPEDIGVSTFEGNPILSLDESDIRSWIKEAWNVPVQPYLSPRVPEYLINEKGVLSLPEHDFVDKEINKETGANELMLDNGIKVVLLPQKKGSENIKVHGFSPIGANCFQEEGFYSAIYAADIVGNAGIGNLDKFDINRYKSSKKGRLKVGSYIKVTETGVKGEASLENMEAMFQLIFLYFTEPRKDPNAFSDWKKKKYTDYGKWLKPTNDFYNAIKSAIGDHTINYSNTTAMIKGLPQVDMDKAYKYYSDLFDRTKDFTFVISGNFDEDTILPLVQKYLGNLPNRKSRTQGDDMKPKRVKLKNGPILFEFPEPYEMVGIQYAENYIVTEDFDWRENIKVETLAILVRNQLNIVLRSQGFPVYSPHCLGGHDFENLRYEVNLDLGFNAKEKEKEKQFHLIQQAIHNLLEDIKNGAISDNDFQQALKEIKGKYSSSAYFGISNIQKRLFEYYKYNAPWLDQNKIDNFLSSLTMKDITVTAKRYLKERDRYEFIMGK